MRSAQHPNAFPYSGARFGGLSVIPGPLPALAAIQFPLIGEVLSQQSQRIYAVQIGGRILQSREPVEAREHATRDFLGASSWFWGIPIVQRLFLRFFAPADIRNALLIAKPLPAPLHPNAGLLKQAHHWIQQVNYQGLHNPLARMDLISLAELHNRKQDLERLWAKTHAHLDPKAKAALEAPMRRYLTRLTDWRKGAMGLGLTLTLFTLGVGINLLNIWMTKNQIKREKAKHPPAAH